MTHAPSRKRSAAELLQALPSKVPRVALLTNPNAVSAYFSDVFGVSTSPALPRHTTPMPQPEAPPKVTNIERPHLSGPPRRIEQPPTRRPPPTRTDTVLVVNTQKPKGTRSITHAGSWRPLESSDSASVASSSRSPLDSSGSTISNDSGTERPGTATPPTSVCSNDTPQPYVPSEKAFAFYQDYTPKQPLNGPTYAPDSKARSGTTYKKKRAHIFQRQHKESLVGKREGTRLDVKRFEELKKRYRSVARDQGYSTEDFDNFADYAARASEGIFKDEPKEKAEAKVEQWFDVTFPLLRDRVLNAPKPAVPFLPSIEQVHRIFRQKDARIDDRLRPPRPSLPSSLPPEDDEYVENTFRKRGPIAKVAREQVGDGDIRRLRPGQWLNDELINFYGALIMSRVEGKDKTVSRGQVLKAFYLSTFFWAKLVRDGYEKGRLAKWTKKVDIFSQDIVLIPVNHNNAHWTAAAINFKKKRFESYDSMNMAKEVVWRKLREYIEAEHLNKKKKPFDSSGWENWAPDSTPQQDNGFDCGVFTCQFLESLSRGEDDFIFTQKDMPYLRRRMVWEIAQARLRSDV